MTNYRQRSTLLQAVIVRRPILGLVLRRGPTAHPTQLSRSVHTVAPIKPLMQQSPTYLHFVNWFVINLFMTND